MERGFYKDYFVLEKKHWFFKARKNILAHFIKQYSRPNSRIFDFGCGSGYLVGELQKGGYDSYGMDFEKTAVDYGLSSGIKNLTVGTGEKTEYSNESFDMVISFDVLEHIEKDSAAVGELVRILKTNGKILITVPAFMWLWGVQDEVSHHFRRYTIKSLTEVFKSFPEIQIVRKTYFNTFLFPVIAAVRLISRWLNIKNRESDFELNNDLINNLLYYIFNLESYFLRFTNFPFGVSILFVLEKKR